MSLSLLLLFSFWVSLFCGPRNIVAIVDEGIVNYYYYYCVCLFPLIYFHFSLIIMMIPNGGWCILLIKGGSNYLKEAKNELFVYCILAPFIGNQSDILKINLVLVRNPIGFE